MEFDFSVSLSPLSLTFKQYAEHDGLISVNPSNINIQYYRRDFLSSLLDQHVSLSQLFELDVRVSVSPCGLATMQGSRDKKLSVIKFLQLDVQDVCHSTRMWLSIKGGENGEGADRGSRRGGQDN